MMLKKTLLFVLFFILCSCGGLEFVYQDNKKYDNLLYNKTTYEFSGKEILSLYRVTSKYFGNSKNPENKLNIVVNEKTIKRSVQSNQAVSKLDYELEFNFSLENLKKRCLVFENKVVSKFSYEPKASGYNFGSDKSLENMYELATEESLGSFLNFVMDLDVSKCKNEN